MAATLSAWGVLQWTAAAKACRTAATSEDSDIRIIPAADANKFVLERQSHTNGGP